MPHRCVRILSYFLVAVILPGCGRPADSNTGDQKAIPAAGPAEWFRDDTTAVGLDFRHEAGPVGSYFMPQIMSGGAALLDFDNDGRFDLYFTQHGGPGSSARNKLYHQRPDGRFEDVSAGSGLDVAGYGMGVAVGDVDNDGFVDVYVSQYGGGRLFRNRGNGTFEDITGKAGANSSAWGTSCAFFDYDRDGWLDLVVVNYLEFDPGHICGETNGKRDYCHPSNFPPVLPKLLHNRGRDRQGRWQGFEDVTHKAGLTKPGRGLGVVCADFNGDGWPDILIANDAMANQLWINHQDGTFGEEAVVRGLALNSLGQAQSNMGIGLGDVAGTGRLDVFITHLTEEYHTLWEQTAPGLFLESTQAAGLIATKWRGTGFGTVLADFDLAGALDIAVANGRVARSLQTLGSDPAPDDYWAPYRERNQLFANDGQGRFRDISTENPAFCGSAGIYRSLIGADFDGDGLMDLVVTTIGGPARFYRNVAQRKGHWLIVRAVEPNLHRDAYGAVIKAWAGGRQHVRMINPGHSYLCSGDPRAHFGLGACSKIDRIQVVWPDGSSELFPGMDADQEIRLCHGHGVKTGR